MHHTGNMAPVHPQMRFLPLALLCLLCVNSQDCSKSCVGVVCKCCSRLLPQQAPIMIAERRRPFSFFLCKCYPESDEGQHGSPATHSSAVGLLNHALHLALQKGCDGLGVLSCNLHLILKSHLQEEQEEEFCTLQPANKSDRMCHLVAMTNRSSCSSSR